ncbi:MAG: hypothetical protein KGI27_01595 [Thaumarchaeota archaeon]|nr:hypothetical protein [Nitrososphaerota archaeon]
MTPTTFINDVIEGFSYPPGFKEEAQKHSFKTVLHRALWSSYYGKMLEEEVYSILGKYDYHIEDGGIDLKERTFWFRMYLTTDEKKIDMDAVHIQFNTGSSLVSVERTLEEVSNLDKLDDAEASVREELEGSFGDAEQVEFEFQEPLDENSITMELTISDADYHYLPDLKEINDVLDKLEYIVRKSLK